MLAYDCRTQVLVYVNFSRLREEDLVFPPELSNSRNPPAEPMVYLMEIIQKGVAVIWDQGPIDGKHFFEIAYVLYPIYTRD